MGRKRSTARPLVLRPASAHGGRGRAFDVLRVDVGVIRIARERSAYYPPVLRKAGARTCAQGASSQRRHGSPTRAIREGRPAPFEQPRAAQRCGQARSDGVPDEPCCGAATGHLEIALTRWAALRAHGILRSVRNRFDQLAKQIGQEALGPSGITVAHDEISPETQRADLRHEPDPAREAEAASARPASLDAVSLHHEPQARA